MSRDPLKPRKLDKRKHHARGYNDGIDESRAARVGFKRYLQQLAEEELLDDIEDDIVDEQDE